MKYEKHNRILFNLKVQACINNRAQHLSCNGNDLNIGRLSQHDTQTLKKMNVNEELGLLARACAALGRKV